MFKFLLIEIIKNLRSMLKKFSFSFFIMIFEKKKTETRKEFHGVTVQL